MNAARGAVGTVACRPAVVGAARLLGRQFGETLHFRVRLTNSSAEAVSLSPCPGYLQERFILGTGDRTGFNTGQAYRLNCRPLRSIPGHAFIDFQMQAKVPEDPPGGPTFSVTWHLIAPYLPARQDLTCGFTVAL